MNLEKKLQLKPRRGHLLHPDRKLKIMRLIITRIDRGVEHASQRQEDETAMRQREEIEQTPILQQLL